MAAASQAQGMGNAPESKPNPDPSIATNDAVERAMKSERDYVDGKFDAIGIRLDGMDKATDLRLQKIDAIPEDFREAIVHLQDLYDEKIKAIHDRLDAAEKVRIEQKADSITGLNAALLAQKDSAAETNRSNTLAISKSEQTTTETIKTNQDLSKSITDALTKSLDELKLQVSRIEATKVGVNDQKLNENRKQDDSRQGYNLVIGVVGAIIAIIVLSMSVYAGLRSSEPAIVEPRIVTVTTP